MGEKAGQVKLARFLAGRRVFRVSVRLAGGQERTGLFACCQSKAETIHIWWWINRCTPPPPPPPGFALFCVHASKTCRCRHTQTTHAETHARTPLHNTRMHTHTRTHARTHARKYKGCDGFHSYDLFYCETTSTQPAFRLVCLRDLFRLPLSLCW